MTASDLHKQREAVHTAFARAEQALTTGRITRAEYEAFLVDRFGAASEREALLLLEDTPSHHVHLLVAGFLVLMAGLFSVLFWSTGGITGAVVLDLHQTFDNSTMLNISLNDTTRITIAGEFGGFGTASITLVHDGVRYLIATYDEGPVTTPHASLARRWYGPNETIAFTATYLESAYLMTVDAAIPLGNETNVTNLPPGEYAFRLFINETNLTQERLAFTVVDEIAQPTLAFGTCGEACAVNLTGDAVLEIVLDGASIELSSITLDSGENNVPVLEETVPDFTAQDTVRIDLALIFSDPDGDELLYTSSSYDGNEETLNGSVLTITGDPGAYSYVVYASDMLELTSSNLFTVTLTGAIGGNGTQDVNATNATAQENTTTPVNATAQDTNMTQQNGTAVPAAAETPLGSCDESDPNKRPLDCLQDAEGRYFRPEDKFVENKNAQIVGKFTPIGNLMIRGEVVEHSAGSPAADDYQLGHLDSTGDFIPTIWIDTQTGDLHLRGSLSEANENIPIESGMSAIANSRGIVLALLDRQTGDMTVRGNVIPYRRSFA